jgi:hypothetical protein
MTEHEPCAREIWIAAQQASAAAESDEPGEPVLISKCDDAAIAVIAAALAVEGKKVRDALACGSCGGPHQFDTSVPSVLWNQVIRPLGISEYLCTSCIVREFAKVGVSFTAELYGDGFQGVPLVVSINNAEAQAAQQVQDQNNNLRSALSRIADTARETLEEACVAKALSPTLAAPEAEQE